jgi:hypothetical protein
MSVPHISQALFNETREAHKRAPIAHSMLRLCGGEHEHRVARSFDGQLELLRCALLNPPSRRVDSCNSARCSREPHRLCRLGRRRAEIPEPRTFAGMYRGGPADVAAAAEHSSPIESGPALSATLRPAAAAAAAARDVPTPAQSSSLRSCASPHFRCMVAPTSACTVTRTAHSRDRQAPADGEWASALANVRPCFAEQAHPDHAELECATLATRYSERVRNIFWFYANGLRGPVLPPASATCSDPRSECP